MDEDPWKVSWLQQEDKTWVLKVLFERGAMQTHFIEGPPSKGLGLSPTNKPDRQELILDGKTFTSTDCQFEQWPDGAKGYSFRYEAKVLQRDGPVVEVGTTAIIEEVGGLPDKMRYCLYKVIEGDR